VTSWVTTGSRLARPSSIEPLEHHQCDNAVTMVAFVDGRPVPLAIAQTGMHGRASRTTAW
jgi:hypothetical protein